MSTSKSMDDRPTFDYLTLRLVIGVVAFLLPPLVRWRSSTPLTSISASYHTEAHDIFVGTLFIIAALFFAYNGHTFFEGMISRVGALAAGMAAIFPTACDDCEMDINARIHGYAAIILFGTILYFCFGPFRAAAIKKWKELVEPRAKSEALTRVMIYLICGAVIALCMLAVVVAQIRIPPASGPALQITYWAEYLSLWAFGIAWLAAGRIISWVRGMLTIRLG